MYLSTFSSCQRLVLGRCFKTVSDSPGSRLRAFSYRCDISLFIKRFCILSAFCIISGFNPIAHANEQPLNFIEIPIDDLKRVIGFVADEPGSFLSKIYPDDDVRQQVRSVLTPNIDALAAQSLVFTNAHASAPICNASRVSLMTGLRPDQTGVTENEQIFRQVPGGASLITIPQHLKDNGYFTTGVGKFFHRPKVTLKSNNQIGSDWPDSQNSWNHWINRDAGSARDYTKAPYSLLSQMKINFGESNLGLEDEHDIINSSLMGELLREGTATIYDLTYNEDVTVTLPADSPFYIGVGILLPHEPFIAPPEILDLFDEDDIYLTADNIQEVIDDVTDLSQGGKGFATTSLQTGKLGGDFQKLLKAGDFIHRGEQVDGDILAWKSAIKHYLAAVAVADRSVGKVLDGLADSPYKDNTAIIIHSDHGFHLGEKNRFGKNTLWDEATGSVLIVHKPGTTGSIIRNNVSLLDIFPTVMSLAGITPPSYISGQDLSQFFQATSTITTGPSITVHGSASNRQTIRTDRYRYIRFKGNLNDAELYDTDVDPFSLTNLIDSPEHFNLRMALVELFDKSFADETSSPVILLPTDKETPRGAIVAHATTAWQANGESISYEAINLPPGMSIDDTSGLISGSPAVTGVYYPEVSATSQSGATTISFAWNVTAEDTSLPYWAGGMIQVDNQDTNSLDISWVGAQNPEELAGYRVMVNSQPAVEVDDPMLSISGLQPGQQYSITVQSVDSSGNVSVDGPTINVNLDSSDSIPPSWSANASIMVSDITTTAANLSWLGASDNNGVDQYWIDLTDNTGSIFSFNSSVNSISLADLLPDSSYGVVVEALDESGNVSITGPELSFTTLPESTIGEGNELLVNINGATVAAELEAASGQDNNPGSLVYADGGLTLDMTGNAWKRMTINYSVTRDTKIRFDFQGSEQALVHGIGFETDNVVSASTTLQLWGTRRFGNQQFRNYNDSVGNVVSYIIPVGEIITNRFYDYLTFISDQNTGPYDASTQFSNISIFEGDLPEPNEPPSWAGNASVSASLITSSAASLSWTAAASSPQRTVSYQVYIDGELYATTADTSLQLDSLTESTEYDVELYAVDDLDNSTFNSLLTRFTTADTPPYWSPGSLAELAGVTASSAQIAWSAATSNSGDQLTYTVLLNGATFTTVANTSVIFDDLDASTTYDVIIQVRDSSGLQSTNTLTLEFRTADEGPYWPIGSDALASAITQSSATIAWPQALSPAGNAVQYDVTLNGEQLARQSSSKLNLNQLLPSATYVVVVTAIDSEDNVSSGNLSVQFETLDTPPYWQASDSVTVNSISSVSAELLWNAATSDAGNAIEYRVSLNGVPGAMLSETTLLLSELAASTIYSVSVSAIDAEGNESETLLSIQFETKDLPPFWPAGSDVQISAVLQSSAMIDWPQAVSLAGNAVEYDIIVNGEQVSRQSGNELNLSQLSASSTYVVVVSAIDDEGNVSSGNLSAQFETLDTPPYWQASETVTVSSISTVSAALSWNAATSDAGNAIEYRVVVNGVVSGTFSETALLLSELDASTAYSISVSAIDDQGNESPQMISSQFVTMDLPPYWLATAEITLEDVTSESALLTWPSAISEAGNAVSYRVYVDNALFATTQQASIQLESLSPLTVLDVEILAMDDKGNDSSNGLSTTFETPIPESTIAIVENGVERFAFIQGFGVQDKTGDLLVTDRGRTLVMIGNRWQYLELDSPASADTVVEFDFQSSVEGGIHGIAIENDVYPSSSKTYRLFGTKSFGIRTFNNYEPSMGVVRYTIPIGQISGLKRFLVFVNDHDVPNPTAESVFSNIVVRRIGGGA